VRRFILGCALVALLTGGSLLAERGWMTAKAGLARVLIDRAFLAHMDDGRHHLPWSWADTHPIARLEVPRLGVRRTVLSGAAGSSLAFGPGHVDGTAEPNHRGNCVLGGHRDSWFAFLEELRVGDEILLESRSGSRRYLVTALAVHGENDASLLEETEDDRLTLITCYPFRSWSPSELRFVVTALAFDGD
jgi:sortase A